MCTGGNEGQSVSVSMGLELKCVYVLIIRRCSASQQGPIVSMASDDLLERVLPTLLKHIALTGGGLAPPSPLDVREVCRLFLMLEKMLLRCLYVLCIHGFLLGGSILGMLSLFSVSFD